MREGCRGVIVGVELACSLFVERAGGVDACQDAPREIAAHGYEVHRLVERGLQPTQVAPDFHEVLVREGFVDRDVVRTPAEMGRGRGLHPRARRAGHGRHMHLVRQ